MSPSFMTEEQLFAKALQVPGDRRATFLGEACGGDAELRARIERLLQLHERHDTILDAEVGQPDEEGRRGTSTEMK